jgi:hypothetical protein
MNLTKDEQGYTTEIADLEQQFKDNPQTFLGDKPPNGGRYQGPGQIRARQILEDELISAPVEHWARPLWARVSKIVFA